MKDFNNFDSNFLTNFKEPDQIILSEYGLVKRIVWMKLERERIGDCKLVKNSKGLIALVKGRKTNVQFSEKLEEVETGV